MDEKKLLRRIVRGDSRALEQAMEHYGGYVYAIAQAILLPNLGSEDVEETAADAFLKLWENAYQVEPGKLRPWLGTVTRNRARDRLRSLRQTEVLEESLEIRADGPESELLKRELRRICREEVEALPEPEKSIFQRRYFLLQNAEQIGAELGMNPATVRTRLARGRAKLRKRLEERGIGIEDELD